MLLAPVWVYMCVAGRLKVVYQYGMNNHGDCIGKCFTSLNFLDLLQLINFHLEKGRKHQNLFFLKAKRALH